MYGLPCSQNRGRANLYLVMNIYQHFILVKIFHTFLLKVCEMYKGVQFWYFSGCKRLVVIADCQLHIPASTCCFYRSTQVKKNWRKGYLKLLLMLKDLVCFEKIRAYYQNVDCLANVFMSHMLVFTLLILEISCKVLDTQTLSKVCRLNILIGNKLLYRLIQFMIEDWYWLTLTWTLISVINYLLLTMATVNSVVLCRNVVGFH